MCHKSMLELHMYTYCLEGKLNVWMRERFCVLTVDFEGQTYKLNKDTEIQPELSVICRPQPNPRAIRLRAGRRLLAKCERGLRGTLIF